MVDSNLQREQITASEKAYAYKMKYDAIKKKAGRKNRYVLYCAKRYVQTVKETIGVGVNEKAALSSDKNCPFVYINFDFTLMNKVASL